MYKLFDREGNGVTAENLCSMMNKLLELKQGDSFANYGISDRGKNETE